MNKPENIIFLPSFLQGFEKCKNACKNEHTRVTVKKFIPFLLFLVHSKNDVFPESTWNSDTMSHKVFSVLLHSLKEKEKSTN